MIGSWFPYTDSIISGSDLSNVNKLPARDAPSNTSHKDNGETIVASEKSFRSVKVKLKKISLQLGLSVKFVDPCNHVCYFHYAILQICMKILSCYECDTEVQRRMEEQVKLNWLNGPQQFKNENISSQNDVSARWVLP